MFNFMSVTEELCLYSKKTTTGEYDIKHINPVSVPRAKKHVAAATAHTFSTGMLSGDCGRPIFNINACKTAEKHTIRKLGCDIKIFSFNYCL